MARDRHAPEGHRPRVRRLSQMNGSRETVWRPGRRGYWPRILVANVVASLVILFVFSGATLSTPIGQLARGFGTAFVFSTCIGPLLGIVMPRVAPAIWRGF